MNTIYDSTAGFPDIFWHPNEAVGIIPTIVSQIQVKHAALFPIIETNHNAKFGFVFFAPTNQAFSIELYCLQICK